MTFNSIPSLLTRTISSAANDQSVEICISTNEGYILLATMVKDLDEDDYVLITHGTNLQDYILSWQDYQEFIKVVDQVYEYLKINEKK